ncbi:DUF4760 domain-containing protein [Terracidiphilus gabretensis]|jgi:hypothetical protein|uniref:DUF4760 domain-containing protein n=1 Tax=Terracidiphilus gabretensis TaxID=1577687 RepID=UPI00071C1790|nr:hypothetical protein [Terracidiphilus gabretensis]
MESVLASPADAEIILKLYDLRREAVLREARKWVLGEFWPTTVEEYLAVASNSAHPQNPYVRQVNTYWEMAAAFVLHGAVSADLFVDCNQEGFFLLAKYSSFLEDMHKRNPHFMSKTCELVKQYPAAAARYEVARKNVGNMVAARQQAASTASPQYAYPATKS